MNFGKTWIVLANLVSILFLSWTPGKCLSQDTEWRRLSEQGNTLSEKGQFAEAEKALLSALAEAQKFDSEDAHLATSQNNLAALYHAQGRYTEAAELYEKALGFWESSESPNQMQTSIILNNLAEVHRVCGRYSQAEPLYMRALALRSSLLGPEDQGVTNVLINLAELSRAQGCYGKAIDQAQQALSILEKSLGPEHLRVAMCLHNLGEYYHIDRAVQRS